ncbi:hypothetical protein FRC12_008372, partial [Ceratobasidium sp. 428]
MPNNAQTKNNVPSSSPTPIRETQPQINSPIATEYGTTPGNALFDTPPEGTQPPELERSQRVRKMSRARKDT